MANMVSVKDIYNYLMTTDYEVEPSGNLDFTINGFCSLEMPNNNRITWVKHASEDSLLAFRECANCVIVAEEKIPTEMKTVCFLITPTPKAVFFSIIKEFWGNKADYGIASSAIVETHNIENNVCIGHNCYIGREVVIGEGTVIEHNVAIYHKVKIGKNCIIHSGTVIGADGFGYYINSNGQPDKVEHFGGVFIGDDVEIGANACIDRGTIDDTRIDSHVKIDNLVHIAHNAKIGESSMIVAGSVICGSARLEKDSYVAPGGIVKNQLKIGTNAFVGMGAVVTRSVEDDVVVAGVPARPVRKVKIGDK